MRTLRALKWGRLTIGVGYQDVDQRRESPDENYAQGLDLVVKLDSPRLVVINRKQMRFIPGLLDDVWHSLHCREDLDPVQLAVARKLDFTSDRASQGHVIAYAEYHGESAMQDAKVIRNCG